MTNFEKWDKEFRAQNLYAFNYNASALLYLKVKAICRSKQIDRFVDRNNLTLSATKINDKFAELYTILEHDIPTSMNMLNEYLHDKNNEWYHLKGVDENKLKSDLHRVKTYEWGGDQENSLDKYLVRQYIKKISDFDDLKNKADAIASNAWKFVQTSWYNNWTSYLIESIFKNHGRILSAVGAIKSVDFFIDDCPIDLKVTYFPSAYLQSKLKTKLGHTELTWLKRQAKSVNILPDSNLSNAEQYNFLKEELENFGHQEILSKLITTRKQIVAEVENEPEELMKWLYENQSPRLFGAENRLFIILVDSNDMNQSWKLKRAFSLIEPRVDEYIRTFNSASLKQINFTFRNKSYTSLSDIIFIIK